MRALAVPAAQFVRDDPAGSCMPRKHVILAIFSGRYVEITGCEYGAAVRQFPFQFVQMSESDFTHFGRVIR